MQSRNAIKHSALFAAVVYAWTAACDSPVGPGAPILTRIDPAWVTGAAAAAVDPGTGLFVLDRDPVSVLAPEVAESAAVAMARLVLNPATIGDARAAYERDRGAPLAAWNRLSACGRTIRVETPFGPAPPETPLVIARSRRAQWAVTLCGPRGDAQLAVSTSDVESGVPFVGSDYWTGSTGLLNGMHSLFGIPPGLGAGTLPSPEATVREVFTRLAVRVAEVPKPFVSWSGVSAAPRYPIWRVILAEPIQATHDDGSPAGALTVVYVRAVADDLLGFFTPVGEQPAQVWQPFPLSLDPIRLDSVAFAVTSPVMFRRLRDP